MPFPDAERVIYKINPLDRVICQLRFPPILRIDSEVPALFQEAIRGEFPLYNEKVEIQQELAVGIKSQFSPEVIKQLSKQSTNKNHEFSSEDNIWKINLNRNFLSISTSQYHKWEEFIEKFKTSLKALSDIYSPPFFTRVGLRYVDIFDRSKLGIPGASWSELLKPHFLGLLSSEIGNDIRHCENVFEVSLAENRGIARIATSFVLNLKLKEQCYMIDSDFYSTQKTPFLDLDDQLNFLHARATRLIRWIITDKLHKAMEPEII